MPGILEAAAPLVIGELVKGGLGLLGSKGDRRGAERLKEQEVEGLLEIQKERDKAALERLEKQLIQQLQQIQLAKTFDQRTATGNQRASVTNALLQAAQQGGQNQSQSLLGAAAAAQNIR